MSSHDPHAKAIYTIREEIAHALSHGLGFAASLVGLGVLVTAAWLRGDARHVVGCAVFGVALVLLYGASTGYHGSRAPRWKQALRVADHAAIYLLIAGTYTPFALVSLRSDVGGPLLASIWSLATLGIALEIGLPRAAERISLPLYLSMGWLGVLALAPLARSVAFGGLVLLVLGGLAYTGGVGFYAARRMPYHHAAWHVCVLAGSALHFSCVLAYVIPSAG